MTPISKRWTVFGLTSGLFLMSMLYRASNAVVAPQLGRDLGLDSEAMGLMGAVFFYVFGLAQLPLGFFLDRIGATRSMVALNLVGVAGAVVFASADGLTGGLAGRALLGVGMSANLMGTLKLYTRWFKPNEFATISGVTVSLGALGGLLATSPLLLLAEGLGWRGAFVFLAGLNLLMAAGLWVWGADGPEDYTSAPRAEKTGLSVGAAAMKIFSSPHGWLVATAAGLRYGVFAAFQTLWAGPFLMIHLGLPAMTAGNLLLMLNVGFVAGAPVGGLLAERVFRSYKKVTLFHLVGMGLSVLALAYWPGPVRVYLLAVLLFLFGFVAAFGQLFYSHIKDLMPPGISGTAMTWVNFFAFMGAGLFLHGLGEILGQGTGAGLEAGGDYYTALMVCFGAMAVATALYAFSREKPLSD